MNQITVRVWLTAGLLVIGFVGTNWVRSGYTFEVIPLSRSLDSLPMELDGYTGTIVPVDDKIAKVLNADSSVDRSYQRPDGYAMSLHSSAWFHPDSITQAAPHLPRVCYVNAGCKIFDERTIAVKTPAGKLNLALMGLERDGERFIAAYWYQIGKTTFTSNAEARKIHQSLWGKKQWPATVKILLQTPSQDIDSAIPRIERFAIPVFQWLLEN